MRISGWGNYPSRDALVAKPDVLAQIDLSTPVIPRGLGRSYGDSSLARRVIDTTALDRFLSFEDGWLRCEAGVSLGEVLRVFVPRGWFLPVTPGTRHVTVGGAIASDVHGKNHHLDGSFSDHVEEFDLMVASGDVLTVSRTRHADLFHATCGGMGLTGIITTATFRLKPISSGLIDETVVKAPSLDAVLAGLRGADTSTYSVAWVDCVARGPRFGRSLLMTGEHATTGGLHHHPRRALPAPPDLVPSFALNKTSVGIFNELYYRRFRSDRIARQVPYPAFFHPLDTIPKWNRLYGRKGFLQYQFLLPAESGTEPLTTALKLIADSGSASPLAVLKIFGPGNNNMLSFPNAGFTLATDLHASTTGFEVADRLDQLVTHHGGRLYLTKDSRMSPATFRATYPRVGEFEAARARYGATGVFESDQSRRLEIA